MAKQMPSAVLCSILSSKWVMERRTEPVPATSQEEKAEWALCRRLETERSLGPVLCSRSVAELHLDARRPVAMSMVVSDGTRMSATELMDASPLASKLVMERM